MGDLVRVSVGEGFLWSDYMFVEVQTYKLNVVSHKHWYKFGFADFNSHIWCSVDSSFDYAGDMMLCLNSKEVVCWHGMNESYFINAFYVEFLLICCSYMLCSKQNYGYKMNQCDK